MIAHVETEHVLLCSQALALVELDVGYGEAIVEHRRFVGGAAHVEKAHRAGVALATPAQPGIDDCLEHVQQTLAGMIERVERAAVDQRLDRALVEHPRIDPIAEIVEVGERTAALTLFDQLRRNTLADVAHRRQSEADRVSFAREVAERRVHIGYEHGNLELAALAEIDRGLVEIRLHAREQRREIRDRMVRLEPRGLVRDEAVPDTVRLVERVVGEGLDLLEVVVRKLLGVPVGHTAGDELGALLDDERADLLAGGLAEVVGLLERIARELLRHAHQLFLVDHQAEGRAEDLLQIGVVEHHGLALVLAFCVLGVPVLRHWTGAIERDHGRDVFEGCRREGAEQRTTRSAFELEHPDRVGPTQELERLRVVERDRVDVGTGSGGALDEVERDLDDVEVAQAEEVHLQQAEVFDTVHLVLRHHRCLFERRSRLGLALDRQVFGERLARDDDGGGVDAVLAA